MSNRLARFAGLWLLLLLGGIAGARAAQLSDSDQRAYRDAFAAVKSGDMAAAMRDGGQARDGLLLPVLRWVALTHNNDADFAEIAAFEASHADWPGQGQLTRRAEAALTDVDDATAAKWFAAHPPVTPAGFLRQAELWQAQGRTEAALARIREVWIRGDFNLFDEKSVLQRYHGALRAADHVARLDRLLWDGQTDAAKRMYRLIEPEQRALAEARLALAALAPGADRLVARVPADLQNDPGLVYERLRWRRRKERYDDAIAMLAAAPREPHHPEAWAIEREVLGRYALAEGKAALAYRIASQHGLVSGAHFAELEFFAGWTALRFLNQAQTAYNHFVRLHDAVKLPISVARGAYWSARAAEAMGSHQLAESWYVKAAAQVTTYYGQLAAAHRGVASTAMVLPEPQPSREEIAAFNRREFAKIARALAEVGADDYVRAFMRELSEHAASPVDHVLVAHLAQECDRPDLAIAAAKQASYAGVTLLAEGYPMQPLPPGGAIEPPLLYAMTRQESAFDRGAVSVAGARGMMQLMPATAKDVARLLQIPFSLPRLTTDVRYNLTLGREYLNGLLNDFAGSYVLSIAAYNAGPARVRQWTRDYGDPRGKKVDVVDWIESIPVSETRNYVQRVLENLQIYRLRIGDTNLAFTLASDLKR